MSSINPYAPGDSPAANPTGVNKVSIRPFQLLKRSYALIADQYWMMLGITLVGILIGSLVPMGILLGPMAVGIVRCFLVKERGETVKFETLFKGFDQFTESLVATLMMLAFAVILILPLFGIVAVVIFAMMAANPNGGDPPAIMFPLMAVFYPLMLLINLVVYLPFLFVYQLIADRKLQAVPAVKLSLQGSLTNLWGSVWFLIAMFLVTLIATLFCYVPVFLVMPIVVGAGFLLYRDVFGPAGPQSPPIASGPPASN